MTQDTLFDLEDLAREAVAATPWHGAPLTYTADYWTPDELDAAFDRYRAEFGSFGCVPRSHMWHRSLCSPPLIAAGHELHLFSVDNRCTETDHDHTAHPLPEGYLGQVICPTCRWHLIDTDSLLVEAWHDHAMPGWRNLPVLPDKLRTRCDENRQSKQRRLEWVQEHYPPQWLFDGAPILTHRTQHGTRAIPGRSPLGGYDITTPDQTEQP